MASESGTMDCSDNVESDSASIQIEASGNELLLPAAAIEPASMEKMPANIVEPMAIDDGPPDSLNPESDPALVSLKSDVEMENIKDSEIDNNIAAADENKKSEASSMTSSKEDTGSSVEKLDSTKPTEVDLDSSIEIISSPVTEEADVEDADAADEERKSNNEESDIPAKTEATGCTSLDNLDSEKAIDVDLDSSIEMIDSPGDNPISSKELSLKDTRRAHIDSDSSIELISSPGKDTNVDSSNKESPTENIESLLEIKQTEIPQKKPNQKDDAAEEIKVAAISTDSGEARHKPANEESAHDTFESETGPQKEENLTPSDKLDETKKVTESKQMDEPMDIEDTTNVCQEKDIGLTELKGEDTSEANIGEKKENTDEFGEENEIYYKKDCINCNCKKLHTQYVRASVAALNYYKVTRKARKRQYICLDCYDTAMEVYEVGEAYDNFIDSS